MEEKVSVTEQHVSAARTFTEKWMTETLHRKIYVGKDVIKDLDQLTSKLTEDEQHAAAYIQKWKEVTHNDTSYSSREIQDNLFETWGLLTND